MTPDVTAILLSRIQFGFTISFHIIFPAFTIGLAAWLAVLEGLNLITGRPVYRTLFDFWLKIFGVAFGLGVVSGIVMAFQFGSNWSELSRRSGPIQGPLLAYESFTAFALEASFFGVLIFGRSRVPRPLYLASAVLVAFGTSLSSFWILVNNSWMQVPTGFETTAAGLFVPVDWPGIILNQVVFVHFFHMILAAYVTTAFCVAATGAWHLLPGPASTPSTRRNSMVEFWTAALGLALLLYILLDGFDLGIGMLFPFAPNERARQHMLSAISPVWDGNETWLVVAAAILFGAFPLVYSNAISAFYLPILLMLAGLILRGVAFEFRYKAGRTMRRVWDFGFVAGSYAATFVQGVTVGAFVAALPMSDGRFDGGPFLWMQPLALTCGVGLCVGYAMMGCCWLVGKTDGAVREFGYRRLPVLAAALLAFLAISLVISLVRHLQVMDRWEERPWLAVFPLAGLLAGATIAVGWKRRRDHWLFPAGAVIFASAFGTLAASFLPYMVPFSITIEAAAPPSSLRFMFWGAGVVVLPLTLAYTAAVYSIFRGRVTDADGYGGDAVAPGLTTRLPVDVPASAAGRMLDRVLSVVAVINIIRNFAFRSHR